MKYQPIQLLLIIFTCIKLLFSQTGVTDNEIILGMSTALGGPAQFLGTSFKMGAETYFKYINDKGGIHGRKIRIIAYDDGYEPNRCVTNVKKLIHEDKVFCLFGNVGTPTTMAIKPIIARENMVLFAPFTGAEPLRHPVVPTILNYRVSYNEEVEEFIHGMVDVLGLKRVAVFYQDDAYGRVVLKGAKIALSKRGLSPVALGTYKRNTENIADGLAKVMAGNPDAVVMVGTYGACAKFIIEGKKKGFDPIYMNVSFVGADKMLKILNDAGQKGEGEVVTQVVPPPTSNLPAAKEFRRLLTKYFPGNQPNFVSFEGFLAAKVFVEGLKRAGKNVNRANFVQAVESIQNLDIGAGNTITFGPDDHQGSDRVYPTVIQNGKYVIIKDWSTLK